LITKRTLHGGPGVKRPAGIGKIKAESSVGNPYAHKKEDLPAE